MNNGCYSEWKGFDFIKKNKIKCGFKFNFENYMYKKILLLWRIFFLLVPLALLKIDILPIKWEYYDTY